MSLNQILTFVIDEEYYGVDVKTVKEVLEIQKITRVPGATDNMLGIINVRGSIVPVLDLRNKISGTKADITIDSAIVVMELGEEYGVSTAGLLVDSVSGVIDFSEDRLEQVKLSAIKGDASYVKGVGQTGENFTIILDGQKVIAGELPEDFTAEA